MTSDVTKGHVTKGQRDMGHVTIRGHEKRSWRGGLGVCTPHAWWKVPCAMEGTMRDAEKGQERLECGGEGKREPKKERKGKQGTGEDVTWETKPQVPLRSLRERGAAAWTDVPGAARGRRGTDAHALLSSHPRVRVQRAELLIFQEMLDAQLLWGNFSFLKGSNRSQSEFRQRQGGALSPLFHRCLAQEGHLINIWVNKVKEMQLDYHLKSGASWQNLGIGQLAQTLSLGQPPPPCAGERGTFPSASHQHHSQTGEAAGSPRPSLPHCYSFQDVSCFPFLPATCTR